MSSADHDRGMKAVARARSVRERDSRIGLQLALRERNEHLQRLRHYEERIASANAWDEGDIAAFLARRQLTLALGEAAREEAVLLAAAQGVADVAHAHWSHDKVRLAAVESLLERRRLERLAERARREATELDDIASQLWIRAQNTTPVSSPQLEVTP